MSFLPTSEQLSAACTDMTEAKMQVFSALLFSSRLDKASDQVGYPAKQVLRSMWDELVIEKQGDKVFNSLWAGKEGRSFIKDLVQINSESPRSLLHNRKASDQVCFLSSLMCSSMCSRILVQLVLISRWMLRNQSM
jgi:hypothetical protein